MKRFYIFTHIIHYKLHWRQSLFKLLLWHATSYCKNKKFHYIQTDIKFSYFISIFFSFIFFIIKIFNFFKLTFYFGNLLIKFLTINYP